MAYNGTSALRRYKGNCGTRNRAEKFRDFREKGHRALKNKQTNKKLNNKKKKKKQSHKAVKPRRQPLRSLYTCVFFPVLK